MMPELVMDGLFGYRVYKVLPLRNPRTSMGLNVDHPEMHGINGIECGPFRNVEYDWTQGGQ